MNVNEYGQVTFSTDEVLEGLYSQNQLSDYIEDQDEILKHNAYADQFEVAKLVKQETIKQPVIEYHNKMSDHWHLPPQWAQIDVEKYCLSKLQTHGLMQENYIETLNNELTEYGQRNMMTLLKFLIYLIDTCNTNNIVSGVGRGSSVSSLVLYLIGVHYIDPVKYNLNYKEFLR